MTTEPGPLLDVLVLGPVEADSPARVDRLLERALMARLAMARGLPVSNERLIADLWGESEERPQTHRLRVLVSRLRVALGEHAAGLSRVNGGYALTARPADLMAAKAAAVRLHAAVRIGDHAAARVAASEALDRWRGPALSDLRGVPFAAVEGERLEAWRLDLLVERLDADLALGAGPEIRDELGRLALEHPLHERLRCLLALVLYRMGRQAEALDQIARVRRSLAEELGVGPAPETAAMELAILRQDPELRMSTQVPPVIIGPAEELVGRAEDLAALRDQVAGPGLVTLVGEPGSGKTRLALEIARTVVAGGRPVTVVELAPLSPQGVVAEAVAAAAGVESSDADPLSGCVTALEGALLVLDNAEHLIEQVAELCIVLGRRVQGLSILVTSQRALLIDGERVHRVGPLDDAAAVRLFELRCMPDVLPAEPGTLETICAAVDRLPLGIELAAGLTRTLTLPQLARRVEDRLRLLVGGSRDAGDRHTSLRAALDWSHELLDERERAVLRRVSVFPGGFELEAAESVAGALTLDPGDIAPALAELADRSLIAVEPLGGRRRFGLLETVRQYGAEKLAAAGEVDAVRAGQLAWSMDHVEAIAEPGGQYSAEQVTEIFREWPNLRDALEHAPGTERAADGLRLALMLYMPWMIRGWYREAGRHYGALTEAPGLDPAERGQALSNHGFISTMAGRLDDAAELLAKAAELLPEVGDDTLAVMVHYHRGIVEFQRARLREARASLLAGEKLARQMDYRQGISAIGDALGSVHLHSGEPVAAMERYAAAVAADRAAGDEHALARGLNNQAQALLSLGRTAAAVELAAESDHYAVRLDDQQIIPLNSLVRGNAALAEGDLAAAEGHLRSAVTHPGTAETGLNMAHVDLADVLIMRGMLDEAAELLEALFAEAADHSIPWLAARAVLAALALAGGDVDRAGELADATAAEYADSGFGLLRYTERLAAVRRELAL